MTALRLNLLRDILLGMAVLGYLVAAKDDSSSTQGSVRTLRRLDDTNSNTNEYFQYDLSDFSLRFEKCQFVKMFSDELAQDEDSATPLVLKNFVVFRLCPSDSCGQCKVYGTYTLDVEQYLQITMKNQAQDFESMCENCDEDCDDGVQYCSDCGKRCYLYNNLEENGYIDASQFIECQQVQVQNNDDDAAGDDQVLYYVGPRCNSGQNITIGLFTDANCYEPADDSVDVESILGSKLSYHLLQHTFSSGSKDEVCLSCAENVYAADDDADIADEDNVNEMCESIYNAAAKCESDTGLQNGFVQINRDEGSYENQVENEFMACTFINSLIWNSYTETGEINVKDTQDAIIRTVSTKQKVALSSLVVIYSALLGLYFYFEKKIGALRQPELIPSTGSLS